jgi:hypothetical protein
MGDGTAEIATLSQKLAALAVAETDKDNVFLQESGITRPRRWYTARGHYWRVGWRPACKTGVRSVGSPVSSGPVRPTLA